MPWYVIVAKNGRAMKAAEGLEAKGFSPFAPVERSYQRRKGRRYRVEKPLLGRYLFATASDADDLHHIRKTADVDHILSSERGPLSVPAKFVEAIRQAESEGKFDKTTRNDKDYHQGQKVRVSAGMFEGAIGQLAKHRGHRRWEVLLSNAIGGGVGKMLAAEDEIEPVGEEAA